MTAREKIILALGGTGFLSQVAAPFLGMEPSYLIMSGSLALLGVLPFLRVDQARRNDRDRDREADR